MMQALIICNDKCHTGLFFLQGAGPPGSVAKIVVPSRPPCQELALLINSDYLQKTSITIFLASLFVQGCFAGMMTKAGPGLHPG